MEAVTVKVAAPGDEAVCARFDEYLPPALRAYKLEAGELLLAEAGL